MLKIEELYGGFGLGLMIFWKLCYFYGGEIGVSFKEGFGMMFGFFFKVWMMKKLEDWKVKIVIEVKEVENIYDKIE